jgi:ubiquinone/menaquinone biosynthesis C-methylase UbiE
MLNNNSRNRLYENYEDMTSGNKFESKYDDAIYDAFYAKYYDALHGNKECAIEQLKIIVYYAKNIKFVKLLDIGCGTGYGTAHLAKHAAYALGVDYSGATLEQSRKEYENIKNLEFLECKVPPITIEDESFDVVTAFQFIEHISNPVDFIKEVYRILKPGGFFLCTTVNGEMSLARNPFHVFEYTFETMEADFKKVFSKVDMIGLQGNDKVNEYYKENNKWVNSILKWDVLGLHKKLPASVVSLPYNLLTSVMRKQLMTKYDKTLDIDTKDFYLTHDNLRKTWDIFVVAQK